MALSTGNQINVRSRPERRRGHDPRSPRRSFDDVERVSVRGAGRNRRRGDRGTLHVNAGEQMH